MLKHADDDAGRNSLLFGKRQDRKLVAGRCRDETIPLTPELRGGIDRIRNYLCGGGYPDPAQNAEQLSYLFFYMFEATDAARVRAARRPGAEAYASAFAGEWTLRNPRNPHTPGEETVPCGTLRWSSWANALNGEWLVSWVREKVEAEGKTARRGLGDALSRDAVRQLHEETFFGNDVDPRMVRLATMNLTLRSLDRVRILRPDAITGPSRPSSSSSIA